jgi:hypothetical protein
MKSFNDYFESKQLAQQERENAIAEQKRKKKLAEESQVVGWDSFTGKQNVVEEYVEWITRNSRDLK